RAFHLGCFEQPRRNRSEVVQSVEPRKTGRFYFIKARLGVSAPEIVDPIVNFAFGIPYTHPAGRPRHSARIAEKAQPIVTVDTIFVTGGNIGRKACSLGNVLKSKCQPALQLAKPATVRGIECYTLGDVCLARVVRPRELRTSIDRLIINVAGQRRLDMRSLR